MWRTLPHQLLTGKPKVFTMKSSRLLTSLAVVLPLQIARAAMTVSISLLSTTEYIQGKLLASNAQGASSDEQDSK